MSVLFDTNVVLDVLLARRPFAPIAAGLMAAVEAGQLRGLLSATSITTIYYLARRAAGTRATHVHVGRLLDVFELAQVGRSVLADALALEWADFEDAVLHEAARHAGAEGIVTRDRAGFARATLRVYAPDALAAALAEARGGA